MTKYGGGQKYVVFLVSRYLNTQKTTYFWPWLLIYDTNFCNKFWKSAHLTPLTDSNKCVCLFKEQRPQEQISRSKSFIKRNLFEIVLSISVHKHKTKTLSRISNYYNDHCPVCVYCDGHRLDWGKLEHCWYHWGKEPSASRPRTTPWT